MRENSCKNCEIAPARGSKSRPSESHQNFGSHPLCTDDFNTGYVVDVENVIKATKTLMHVSLTKAVDNTVVMETLVRRRKMRGEQPWIQPRRDDKKVTRFSRQSRPI